MNAITDFTRETIEKRRSASYRDAKRYKGNVEELEGEELGGIQRPPVFAEKNI